ncbi:MAG: DUF4870 domain-containing protein [Candidatus Moranbacteria bacterium]|nr:DUF4870 domain-containing protein [Candidatus Moranbacteria bacterium]
MSPETKTGEEKNKKTDTNTTGGASSAKDLEENKAVTFLSYLGILCLIPLLAKKESKFAQFHAKQGLVLFISWLAIAWISGFIPVIGWFIIAPAVSILGIVLSIMGLINVAQGEMKELPIVGEIAKKFEI